MANLNPYHRYLLNASKEVSQPIAPTRKGKKGKNKAKHVTPAETVIQTETIVTPEIVQVAESSNEAEVMEMADQISKVETEDNMEQDASQFGYRRRK